MGDGCLARGGRDVAQRGVGDGAETLDMVEGGGGRDGSRRMGVSV